jgi:hypothetical protein
MNQRVTDAVGSLIDRRWPRPVQPAGPAAAAPPAAAGPAPARVAAQVTDVSGIAATVRAGLEPRSAARDDLLARVPALGTVLPAGELPAALGLVPVFEDPLSDDLSRLGTSWLLPGGGSIGRNRVRLVEVNTAFVGRFLVGANHELARELLWRGYPVDVAGTFFHRFWPYTGSPPRADIGELAGWHRADSVLANLERDLGAAAVASTVIVVRGDLVRRYPSARYFLQPAVLTGAADRAARPGPGDATLTAADATPDETATPFDPIFAGALAPDTVFLGFEPAAATVIGDRAHGDPGYFVGIEEQAGAPRLGLDVARPRHFSTTPAHWDQVSWGHLVSNQEELDALTHADAEASRLVAAGELDGVTWGRNAAHLARAVWQRPFRMYIHADLLVDGA